MCGHNLYLPPRVSRAPPSVRRTVVQQVGSVCKRAVRENGCLLETLVRADALLATCDNGGAEAEADERAKWLHCSVPTEVPVLSITTDCGGRGFRGWKGRGPSAVDSTPRGHPQIIPIRASAGMTCPNLREIGSGRGRGFPQWFSQPPYYFV